MASASSVITAAPKLGATTKVTTFAGVAVTISEPIKPQGIVFLLPGSMIQVSEYDSTRDVLLEKQLIVLSFYVNVLTTSHEKFVQNVIAIFQDYHENQHPELPNRFHVVGHSVGAKVALLLAATCPLVDKIVALDPVDLSPSQFTKKDNNISLKDSKATSITLTWATGTSSWCLPPAHNAQAIYTRNEAYVAPLVRHEGAGHMCYTDHGGGMAGWIMTGGTKEANKNALEDTHKLLQKLF
jgi:dienelactone hydrolase